MHNSGVYQITNKVNGHIYIGSSIGLLGRKSWHFKDLVNDCHHNQILQRAYNKYGIDNLEFQILLYCDPEMCVTYEQMIMDGLKPYYNICPTAGSCLGRRFSKESRQKMSDSHSGKKLSEEHKRNLSEALCGRKLSEKNKKRIGEAKRGKKFSEEHKKNLRKSQQARVVREKMNGVCRKHSEESKRKMSNARKEYWRKVHAEQQ